MHISALAGSSLGWIMTFEMRVRTVDPPADGVWVLWGDAEKRLSATRQLVR
jgi:hypothetical protein